MDKMYHCYDGSHPTQTPSLRRGRGHACRREDRHGFLFSWPLVSGPARTLPGLVGGAAANIVSMPLQKPGRRVANLLKTWWWTGLSPHEKFVARNHNWSPRRFGVDGERPPGDQDTWTRGREISGPGSSMYSAGGRISLFLPDKARRLTGRIKPPGRIQGAPLVPAPNIPVPACGSWRRMAFA